jgi:hypothetical protein
VSATTSTQELQEAHNEYINTFTTDLMQLLIEKSVYVTKENIQISNLIASGLKGDRYGYTQETYSLDFTALCLDLGPDSLDYRFNRAPDCRSSRPGFPDSGRYPDDHDCWGDRWDTNDRLRLPLSPPWSLVKPSDPRHGDRGLILTIGERCQD